jgi:uncharacterized membrane protein YfcA
VVLPIFVIGFLILLGVFVGLSASLFGLGGGVFIVPILPSVLSVSAYETVLISLATVMTVVFTNVIKYSKMKLLDWPKALTYAPFASLGGVLAAYAAGFLSQTHIRFGTGLLLLFLGVRLFIKPSKIKLGLGRIWLSLISSLAGLASGLTGVGTGAVLSPIFMREKIVPSNQVAPTGNAILLITTIITLITYYVRSSMGVSQITLTRTGLECIVAISLGAQASGVFGRKIHVALSEQGRRILLSLVTSLLGLWVLIRVFYA